MAAASRTLYTGDGVIKQFNISFPFISSAHLMIFVNEALQLTPMHYTLSGSTVTFNDAPEQDAAIEFKRNTSPLSILVDFTNGSVLNESDLDTAYLHNFYLMQEVTDGFHQLINEAFLNVATGAGIVLTDTDEVIAALVNEMLQDAAAATLQQRVNDIDTNAEAIIQLGTDIQVQVNTIAQGTAAVVYIQAAEPVPGVGGIPDPILDGARWYDSDDNNKPYIYDQVAVAWVSIEDPRIGVAVADITVLQANVVTNAAAVITEQTARANADSAIATDLLLLGAANGGDTAFILDLNTTEIGGGESLGTRFTSITADKDTNAASIVTEASARATADTATAVTIALMGAENGAKTAFILDTSTVKIDSDGGDTFATRLTALGVSDSDNAASITTIQDVSLPAITARYGVTLNVNGYITGFQQINDGSNGIFVILADKFAVVDPTGDPGETEYVPFEIVNGKINMRGDVTIDGNLMINGTINGLALINGTIGSTQIGANAITTTQLNANAVTANKIAANAVTADKILVGTIDATKISVANLAAIDADLGAITAGNITLDTSGYIKGGQTAFFTGTGFFLGYESGAYQFSIGNQTDFIKWDGSSLVVRGNVSIGSYSASNTIMLSATTARTTTGVYPTTQMKKSFSLNRPGTVRVTFDAKISSTAGGIINNGAWAIKLDGSTKESGSITSTSYSGVSKDITLGSGSLITIEITNGNRDPLEPVVTQASIQNAYIKADKNDGEVVITD